MDPLGHTRHLSREEGDEHEGIEWILRRREERAERGSTSKRTARRYNDRNPSLEGKRSHRDVVSFRKVKSADDDALLSAHLFEKLKGEARSLV
jgi:hypothetical protein